MEPDEEHPQESLSELCQRADSEEDFDKLLELADKIQKRLEARLFKVLTIRLSRLPSSLSLN